MVARGLRWTLVIKALGVGFCAWLLIRFAGLNAGWAFALGLGALLGLNLLLVLVTFALCWPRQVEVEPSPRLGVWGAITMIVAEWLSFFALFAIIQPFADSFFAVKPGLKPESQKTPVVLVHGYRCNSGLWWWMARHFHAAGFSTYAIDLEPALASIDTFAEQLHDVIETCRKETQSETVSLVTHSMGGLVARAYLFRYGSSHVDRLITLACVHHGTRLARLGQGLDAREMRPGSAWLATLPEPAPVSTVSIWSQHDNFIASQTSSRLAGAKNIALSGIGHLTFVFSPHILTLVLKELG